MAAMLVDFAGISLPIVWISAAYLAKFRDREREPVPAEALECFATFLNWR